MLFKFYICTKCYIIGGWDGKVKKRGPCPQDLALCWEIQVFKRKKLSLGNSLWDSETKKWTEILCAAHILSSTMQHIQNVVQFKDRSLAGATLVIKTSDIFSTFLYCELLIIHHHLTFWCEMEWTAWIRPFRNRKVFFHTALFIPGLYSWNTMKLYQWKNCIRIYVYTAKSISITCRRGPWTWWF